MPHSGWHILRYRHAQWYSCFRLFWIFVVNPVFCPPPDVTVPVQRAPGQHLDPPGPRHVAAEAVAAQQRPHHAGKPAGLRRSGPHELGPLHRSELLCLQHYCLWVAAWWNAMEKCEVIVRLRWMMGPLRRCIRMVHEFSAKPSAVCIRRIINQFCTVYFTQWNSWLVLKSFLTSNAIFCSEELFPRACKWDIPLITFVKQICFQIHHFYAYGKGNSLLYFHHFFFLLQLNLHVYILVWKQRLKKKKSVFCSRRFAGISI